MSQSFYSTHKNKGAKKMRPINTKFHFQHTKRSNNI